MSRFHSELHSLTQDAKRLSLTRHGTTAPPSKFDHSGVDKTYESKTKNLKKKIN